jgi:hypothetical protein
MPRLIVAAAVSLSLSLVSLASGAVAQEKNGEGITTNADGSYVTSTAGVNPTANGGGGTVIYGDINTGPGYTVIEPPAATTSPPAATTSPPPAPAAESAPAPATGDTAVAAPTETGTVATADDLDADNYPDVQEPDLGLDPNNPDTDGDGVADGDELTIYGTDPTVFDTDGDGVSDGEELFGIHTDPLVWDDVSADDANTVAEFSDQAADVSMAQQASTTVSPQSTALAQETTEHMTATDGDASALGDGSASAAPGTVIRDGGSGTAMLGPDGTYRVSEIAPPSVNVAGDTDVLAPPVAAPAPGDDTAAPNAAYSCDNYGSWYDAQVAYEAAGITAADPAMVSALDPDYDGIACEEGM